MKQYKVRKIETEVLKIDGSGNNDIWKSADLLDDFLSPWDTDKIKKIEFKALWDTHYLFFNFKVYDGEVHIAPNSNSIESINNSDRVELFFRSDSNMNPYYCLEIDPSPRLMDFKAHPNKNFDFNWNWSVSNIEIKSLVNEEYFVVEGAISIESLNKLNLINNGKIHAGVYRAKYNEQKKGVFEPTWITWVNPNTESPNFHIGSSFGEFLLQ